jgi:anaerobic magnesium-protoporphyrin IX monomethyl ester cyclase
MKKRVLLVYPPRLASQPGRVTFPRGTAQIASFLQTHGWPVSVVPLQFAAVADVTPPEIVQAILESALAEFRPDVVGVSCPYTICFHTCIEILQEVKRFRNDIVTVIGGPHVTFTDAETVEKPCVDFVVRGEGEWTLAALLSVLEQGGDPANVRGLTFRRRNMTVRTPGRPPGDLAELPPIDFTLFPPEFIQRCQIFGMIHRGCKYRCSFCAEAAFWGSQRSLPTDRLIHEIEELATRYGARMLGIEDSAQWLGSPELQNLGQRLGSVKQHLPPAFFLNLTVEPINPAKKEFLRDLRQAGVGSVWLGIENSSEKVLSMMGKKRPWKRTLEMCRALREEGFLIKAEWMIGHPGDTREEALDAYHKLDSLFREDLITSSDFGVFVPLPGTKPWKDPARYGIDILHCNYKEYNEFSTTNPVCRLKDFPVGEIAEIARRTERMIERHTQVLRPARIIADHLGAHPPTRGTPSESPPAVSR